MYRSSPSSADDDQSPLSPDRNHWSSPNPGNEYPSSYSSVATTRAISVRSSDYMYTGLLTQPATTVALPAWQRMPRSAPSATIWSSSRSVGSPAQLVTLSALTSWSDAITYPVKLSLVVTHLLPSELSQLRQRIPGALPAPSANTKLFQPSGDCGISPSSVRE